MRIGFFTDAYFPQVNGVVTSVYETAKELRNRGHDVVIIAPSYPNYKDKKEENVLRLSSIPVHKKLNIRIATHFPDRNLLRLYKEKFDIVHSHGGGMISLLGLEIAKLKKIPSVFTYHTLWNKYTHYFLKGIVKPKVVEKVSRILCNRFTAIIAPTDSIKNELISYGIKKPIFVVPSGVDFKKFKVKNTVFLRKKLKLKSKNKILLFIGRLGKEKSIDFLVEAFALIAKEDKDTVLVIVGEGEEKKNLESFGRLLGIGNKVYFAGNIDFGDMPFVYKDADLLLFSSKTETQGLVILEALAGGLPVIAVKDAVYKGIIKDNINGILVNNSPKEFSKACLKLLKKPLDKKSFLENSVKSVKEFSISTTAKTLEKLYEKLIY
ncbi:MAG: hypothetical protein A3D74_04970 [Candidatus Levybacteria bacterium RIFCSPHIGHO2_02_FULL_37_13]|nr:MAG: hypothetical protein A3D74_04970 [Candidatus Levybacteria bacterium RIFCSPHIGHO2_02_FULL_37_13]OGH30428.1 MAG: hypothetical protein A3E40_05290 [Candidatus Levybacteria bacterium RIFCSPHIGHO2_12_FULL_37_9]OGH40150.1 MAG: hypothetical protein A3B41_04845 [Candidatus Levybacteria bacterium RIFCSPLOWO2_01_FULL_37_26]